GRGWGGCSRCCASHVDETMGRCPTRTPLAGSPRSRASPQRVDDRQPGQLLGLCGKRLVRFTGDRSRRRICLLLSGSRPRGDRRSFRTREGPSDTFVAFGPALDTEGVAPSAAIRKLVRIVEWLNSRLNPLFAASAAPLLLWSTQFAFA